MDRLRQKLHAVFERNPDLNILRQHLILITHYFASCDTKRTFYIFNDVLIPEQTNFANKNI